MNKAYVARAEIVIHASASDVWDAITKPEIIKQYLFGTEVTTDWQVGSPITYKGLWEEKAYEDKGEILQVEKEKVLVSTFWSSLSGKPDMPEYYKTIRYELSSAGDGTRLVLTQDNNDSEEEANLSAENWKGVLGGIKKIVEG
jgi:uncharacterized protein YndB with AHSA1/START domain